MFSKENHSKYIAVLLLVLGTLLNPLLFFIFLVLLLLIPLFISKFSLKTITMISYFGMLNGSIIVSSRNKFEIINDDFIRYYEKFFDPRPINHSVNLIDMISGNLEISFNIFNRLIRVIWGNISPQGLMLVYSITISFLVLYVMNKYLLKYIKTDDHGIVLAFIIAFFPFLTTTQLVAQSLATPFIIIALFSKSKKAVLASAFIATTIHVSSLIVILIYALGITIVKNSNKNSFKILVAYGIVLFIVLNNSPIVFDKVFLVKSHRYLNFASSGVISHIATKFIQYAAITFTISLLSKYLHIIFKKRSNKFVSLDIVFSAITLIILVSTYQYSFLSYRLSLFFMFMFGPLFIIPMLNYKNTVFIPLLLTLTWKLSSYFRVSEFGMGLWHEFGKYDVFLFYLFK